MNVACDGLGFAGREVREGRRRGDVLPSLPTRGWSDGRHATCKGRGIFLPSRPTIGVYITKIGRVLRAVVGTIHDKQVYPPRSGNTEEGGRFPHAWVWFGSGRTSPARSGGRTTGRFVDKRQAKTAWRSTILQGCMRQARRNA